MLSDKDYIVQFMTRSFEKNVDFYMLSDKNYMVPKQKVIGYIDRALDIPYYMFIEYIREHEGIVKDDQLTQSSNFASCSSMMCQVIESQGNPGMKFIDIGRLFPQHIKHKNEVAFRKYGENQVKTSAQLGLTFEYYDYWYLTCIGYVYNDLEQIQQEALLARTVLRVPLYQDLLLRLLKDDVFITDYMKQLAPSTQGRRAGSIIRLLDFCLNECRRNDIYFHNVYYPIYVAKTKTIKNAIIKGTVKPYKEQQHYLLRSVADGISNYNFNLDGTNKIIKEFNYEQCYAHYSKRIMNIRQAKINGEVIVAKPVLLLTIIDSIEEGRFLSNRFKLTDWFESRYVMLMQQYTRKSQFPKVTDISNPFWHLSSDGFWHLNCKVNVPEGMTPSKKWLKDNVEYAYLNDDLWVLLQNQEWRKRLRDFIIEKKLTQH